MGKKFSRVYNSSVKYIRLFGKNVTGNATTKEYQSFFRGLLFQSSDEKPFRLTSEDRLEPNKL